MVASGNRVPGGLRVRPAAVWGIVAGAMVLSAVAAARAPASEPSMVRVKEALRLELAGQNAARNDLLRAVLDEDPECAAAHWHSGEIRFDRDWLTAEEFARRAGSDARLAEYRRVRSGCAATAAAQAELARWCRQRGLTQEGRAHWMAVLAMEPGHREARRELGIRAAKPAPGAGEAEREYQDAKRKSAAEWKTRLTRWRTALAGGDSAAADPYRRMVREIAEPYEFEALVAQMPSGRAVAPNDAEAWRNLSVDIVRSLDDNTSELAVLAAVCIAVDSPWPEVRSQSVELFRRRPLQYSVPPLLAMMPFPIEARYSLVAIPDFVSVARSYYQAGPLYDREISHLATQAGIYRKSSRVPEVRSRSIFNAASVPIMVRRNSAFAASAAAGIAEERRQIEHYNASVKARNENVGDMLARSTGAALPANPERWWKWWQEYLYEYYELEPPASTDEKEKPVYRYTDYISRASVVLPSCFAPGTPVWTLDGPMPIEKIKIGERVLAQDPATGELAYKPVLAITTRNPSPMVAVGLGTETIIATRGHPFWVVGRGWRMSKQLEPGQSLHQLTGAIPIDSVEAREAAQAWYDFSYNLVVEGFHTYFVGESRVLVHDNWLTWLQNKNVLPGLASSDATSP